VLSLAGSLTVPDVRLFPGQTEAVPRSSQ
jgi:hypothetical protein